MVEFFEKPLRDILSVHQTLYDVMFSIIQNAILDTEKDKTLQKNSIIDSIKIELNKDSYNSMTETERANIINMLPSLIDFITFIIKKYALPAEDENTTVSRIKCCNVLLSLYKYFKRRNQQSQS